MTGDLKVLIVDERGATSEQNIISPQGKSLNELNNETKISKSQQAPKTSKAISYATMYAMQSIDYIVSTSSKWQGSQIGTANVNNAKTVIGLGFGLAQNPIATLLATSFSLTTTAINYNLENNIDRKRRANALKRAGYNSNGEMIGRRGQ